MPRTKQPTAEQRLSQAATWLQILADWITSARLAGLSVRVHVIGSNVNIVIEGATVENGSIVLLPQAPAPVATIPAPVATTEVPHAPAA